MKNENKPDYEFDAYLKADNQSSVLCNVAVWLPKDADENVHVEIDSPEKRNIVENFKGKFISVESEVYQDKPQFSAILSRAWIQQLSAQLKKRKLARTRIKLLRAGELTILEKRESADDSLEITVYFQLSNLLYAQPDAWVDADYLGSRNVEITKNYTAQSSTGLTFKIEKHYSGYSKVSQNKEVVSSQNVISVTGQICVAEFDTLYKETNDFALLLIFAARHQVMVLGYEYWAESKRVRCFNDPFDRYQVKDEEVVEDALIPIERFELFVNGALGKWHSIHEKVRLAIKDAIYAIHPFNNSHQSFLDMFSAFEGIINISNTKVGTEIDSNWDCLQKNLNACIDNQKFSDSANEFLKESIKNLRNSETFKNKTEYRLNELGIVVSDLWPIFGDKSLYKIRNELAHGRRMKLDSVYRIAQEQLQFLLERLVLVLLGFDYNKSTAGLTNHGIRFRYSKQEIADFQNQLKSSNS